MNSTLPTGRSASPGKHDGPAAPKTVREWFRLFAGKTATAVGSPWAFLLAVMAIIVWAVTGPMFKYSDTWQLVINTGTTIITFLMVFLIQNTQNRDARAIHLKLDELIRGTHGPRNRMVDLEDCTDDEIKELEEEFKHFRERHQAQRNGKAHPESKSAE